MKVKKKNDIVEMRRNAKVKENSKGRMDAKGRRRREGDREKIGKGMEERIKKAWDKQR